MNQTQHALLNSISKVDTSTFNKIMDENPDLTLDYVRYKCQTPLIVAIRRNNEEMANRLLDAGADPDFQSENGSPLIDAIRYGQLSIAQRLIDQGVNVNTPVGNIYPVVVAVRCNNVELTRLLLDNNVDVSVKSESGQDLTQLTTNEEILDMLVEKGLERPVSLGQMNELASFVQMLVKMQNDNGKMVTSINLGNNDEPAVTFDDGTSVPKISSSDESAVAFDASSVPSTV